jgi:hypothetical protein
MFFFHRAAVRAGAASERGLPPLFRRGLSLSLIILSLAGCASLPGVKNQTPEGDLALLPPGASLYLYADVAGARPILELLSFRGIGGADIPQILDRTDSAAAAFYPEGMERRFLAAARGKYPSFRTGLSFAVNSSWKKRRSSAGGHYWYSTGYKLAAVIGRERALISDTDPLGSSPGTRAPEGFEDLSRGAVLAGWLPGAAARIDSFLAARDIPLQVPVELVLFGIYPSGGGGEGAGYEIILCLETPSESHAQGLAALISMMRLLIADAMEPGDPFKTMMDHFFTLPPVRNGTNLSFRSGPVDATEMALLFNLFSLYSVY